MNFGTEWAEKKLDMIRRSKELRRYISTHLGELIESEDRSRFVIDIGCGPGDLLYEIKCLGYENVVGVDAPDGENGMGDAYLNKCREIREERGIHVYEIGLNGLLESEHLFVQNSCACINLRGSIEQAMSDVMVGPPHHEHHDCKKLDWNKTSARDRIAKFCEFCYDRLSLGGILMIHANGTGSTNEWYDRTIRECAEDAGLTLVKAEKNLIHKWVKK